MYRGSEQLDFWRRGMGALPRAPDTTRALGSGMGVLAVAHPALAPVSQEEGGEMCKNQSLSLPWGSPDLESGGVK